MAARPASPTSLLWAHQLKREHGYLLKRIQDSEASNERQAKRVKTLETAAKSDQRPDITALAKQLKDLESNGLSDRLAKMEKDLKQKTEDLEAGSETMNLAIAGLQQKDEDREEEKRKAFTKEKALLKRIAELEAGLKTYEQVLGQLGRKIDGVQMEGIKGQLEGLTRQVRREGEGIGRLAESVNALERANVELRGRNEELQKEIEGVAARPAVVGSVVGLGDAARAGDGAGTSSAVESVLKRGRKRKISQDQIDGAAATHAITTVATPDDGEDPQDVSEDVKPAGRARPAATKSPAKAKGRRKPIPPHPRPAASEQSSSPRPKSHKWSGGGPDKDIIRSGKGWLEVAVSEDEFEGPTLRPVPVAPKKRIPTPRWTVEEANTQARATRRPKEEPAAIEVDAGPKGKARVKKAAKQALNPMMPSKRGAPVDKPVAKSGRSAVSNSMASVVSSPPQVEQPKPQPSRAPPKRRRIIQDD